jgi:regulation of enolase protein 1 (concanavalin A-like superfamily)
VFLSHHTFGGGEGNTCFDTPSIMALNNGFNDSGWSWLYRPDSWGRADDSCEQEGTHSVSEDGSQLSFYPPARRDFWSRTFYTPLLKKSDASGYLFSIDLNEEATIKVDFEFTPRTQFDQAGLLVYLDDEHWMKCGIEYCDGHPQLSVVVCNCFSDWSVQPWTHTSARIKIHKVNQSRSVVVEAAPLGSEDYKFIRIAHLSTSSSNSLVPSVESAPCVSWRVGPFSACPISQQGCRATFFNMHIGPSESTTHNSDSGCLD